MKKIKIIIFSQGARDSIFNMEKNKNYYLHVRYKGFNFWYGFNFSYRKMKIIIYTKGARESIFDIDSIFNMEKYKLLFIHKV